jgi:hypothetical protein
MNKNILKLLEGMDTSTDFYKAVTRIGDLSPFSVFAPGKQPEDIIEWEIASWLVPDNYIGGGKIFIGQTKLFFDKDGGFLGYGGSRAHLSKKESTEHTNFKNDRKLWDILDDYIR